MIAALAEPFPLKRTDAPWPRVSVLLTLAVVTLFALTASSATASTHVFSTTFGEGPANPYPLGESVAVAVDDSTGPSAGDVYIADTANHWVEKFNSAGDPIWIAGKEVDKTAVEEPLSTEAERNLCVIALGDVCQVGASASSSGAFESPSFLAIDGSSGPSAGDLYVGDPGDNLVSKLTADGAVVESWGNNGPGTSANGQLNGLTGESFAPLLGVAVDQAGNLIVLGRPVGERSIFRFVSGGSFIQQSDTGGVNFINPTAGIAVDSADDVYLVREQGDVAKIGPSGIELSEAFAPASAPASGLAVDPANNDVYVDRGAEIDRYDSSGTPLESFGAGHLTAGAGLAVSPVETVYAADPPAGRVAVFGLFGPFVTVGPATAMAPTTATIHGRLGPTAGGNVTACHLEYASAEEFVQSGFANAKAVPCSPPPSYSTPTSVSAQLSELNAGTAYHFRLAATDANTTNLSPEETFTTLGSLIDSTSASGVSATSATLDTEINPRGSATSFHFEYVTQELFEAHGFSEPLFSPTGSAGSGGSDLARSALVLGLAPSTAYRYRVIAESHCNEAEPLELCTSVGAEHSLTTQPAVPGPTLPDNRAWEMVSPPEKAGATISGIGLDGEGALQASADGSALAFYANGPFGQEAAGNRSFTSSQFLARREAGGWSTKDLTPPREDVVGFEPGRTSGYEVFSQNLSFGALQSHGTTLLSPQATGPTPYLRVVNGEYVPLVNAGNVPPETVFDGKVSSSGLVENEPRIEGGSPDLHSVVLGSCFKLTEDSSNMCGESNELLYLWRDGVLQLASVLPSKQPAEAELGRRRFRRHAVSDDGMRFVFTAGKGLYLRDAALAETVQLDQPEAGAAGGTSSAQFEDMSADGSRVFFTDGARLTTNSDADSFHPDLYMCEVVVENEALGCALKDLSVALKAGESGNVLVGTLGADSSGRYVYFVANGSLVPGAAPGDCGEASGTGDCGLYLYDTVAGTVKLVTTLSGADFPDWAGAQDGEILNQSSARVSPNGRYLAFMSQRGLTGYDNHDAVSGQPDEEVYLYDRLGNGGEGKLVCASCNPTGARPHGLEAQNVFGSQLMINGAQTWLKTWLAATIPGWTPSSLIETQYQSRYLSDSGRLFFDSVDALVPEDSNGVTDVYEYEPQGEGQPTSNNCTNTASTYSPDSGGCVNLISSGTSGEESGFLDASESGDDVFFLTAAKLSSADIDTAPDIYDARVDGSEPEPVKPPSCEGDACQSPANAPEDPTPGSLTFQGPGNLLAPVSASVRGKAKPSGRAQKLERALKACARRPKRKQPTCERRARRSYGPVGKTKSNRKAKKSNWRAH